MRRMRRKRRRIRMKRRRMTRMMMMSEANEDPHCLQRSIGGPTGYKDPETLRNISITAMMCVELGYPFVQRDIFHQGV
eukprot:2662249-Pyramimonas_sp.AAC.1